MIKSVLKTMVNKNFIVIAILSSCLLPLITCECVIEDGAESSFVGAFQKIGNQIFQMPITRQLTLEEDSSVYLLCPGGFELEGLSETDKFVIEVRCKEDGFTEYKSFNKESEFHDNSIITGVTETNEHTYDDDGNAVTDDNGNYVYKTIKHIEKLRTYPCKKRALQLFLGNEKDTLCDQASYVVGYQLGDKVIILLEICYNAIDKRLEFIHFIQSYGTHPISESFNPVNTSSTNHANLPAAEYFVSLQDAVSKMGQMSRLFRRDSLISTSILENFPSSSFSSLSRISNLVWLKDLIDGQSWKIFHDLLDKRTKDVQYEIFIGTSEKIPSSHTPSSCSNDDYNKEVNIPKYIWTYMKSQDDEVDEELLVIGVNSPFVDYDSRNETIFCKDICNTIDWLKPVEKVRQMPYMGIIFCCEATEEVKTLLNGFPMTK